MYEGINIHYSQSADQKPLCSFSGKICNQRRLNHYGFCVRHILEDATAPFKRCAYVAKSSRQTCTQPIPKNEEREYCNNHMQVLGMLPKKERKPKKEKERLGSVSTQLYLSGAKSDPGLLQNKIKPRLTAGHTKSKLMLNKLSSGGEEMEDVYTFPADNSENKIKGFTAMISTVALPGVTVSGLNNTHDDNVTKATVDVGQSSLAKIYPELAEKLEKIKPKVETKNKGKVKSSRTMNSLQTKIAQNKIKDKLKRNQCSSNTSSQSQSPSHSYTSSPGYQINTSSPSHPAQSVNSPSNTVPPNVTVVRDGLYCVGGTSATLGATSMVNIGAATPHSRLNLLNGLNLQTLNLSLEQLGLPVPTVSDIEQTLKQLASAANIPLEGSQMFGTEAGVPTSLAPGPQVGKLLCPAPDLQHLLPQTFAPQSRPPPPYSSVHHKPVVTDVLNISVTRVSSSSVSQAELVNKHSLTTEHVTGHQIKPVTVAVSSSSSLSQVVNVPFVTRQYLPTAPHSGAKCVPTSTIALSSPTVSSSSSSLAASLSSPSLPAFPGHPMLTLLTTSQSSSNVLPIVTETAKQLSSVSGPQPPGPQPPKAKSRARSRNPSSAAKRPVPLFSLPMTVVKPRKIPKLLDEEDVKKLKTKSAIEYYNKNKRKRIDQHSMICSSIASSDESDLSDCDMLPWQPDWFRASSDEEAVEDEDENDYGLRTTKLALGRARLRRQCSQARLSTCTNRSTQNTTSSLLKAARESSRSTVKCLYEISCIKAKSPERVNSKGLVKRRCLYRDNDEVQCRFNVVPYTNHCIKHVMYNVDQQLFEYCTAKFADNTQCCHPVFDVKHELPLCIEHGVKADNFLKAQDLEPKPKRPRKKTKPSALTRPPKKGKKKKNQRKMLRPQKPVSIDSEEAQESENEEVLTRPYSELNADSDSDKGESQSSATDVAENEKPAVPPPAPIEPEPITSKQPSLVVRDGVKPGTSYMKQKKRASSSQLEELENLTSLSELENVKMFGDLETTASKLLEENDFQEVFNRLPDTAFDIFTNKSSGLPSTVDLQDFEDSLALANREMKLTKDIQDPLPTSSSKQPVFSRQSIQPQASVVPILSQSQASVTSMLVQSQVSGSVAHMLGQPHVSVTSILTKPQAHMSGQSQASVTLMSSQAPMTLMSTQPQVLMTPMLAQPQVPMASMSAQPHVPMASVSAQSQIHIAQMSAQPQVHMVQMPAQPQVPMAQMSTQPQVHMAPMSSQPQVSMTPMLDDDLTRQIAEEIMKQDIGASVSLTESMCNGDAEESIKAIARSLSNSGMMLAAEAKHKSQSQEAFTCNPIQSSQSLSREQSLPVYSNLDSYYPPNVAIQHIPVPAGQQVTGLVPTSVWSKGQGHTSQGQITYAGQLSTNLVPQNVTVTPQGIITSHLGSSRLAPGAQTVTIGNTTVTGNQTAGIITLPVPQQLTAQQLSALVQQATAHLPPLPPYTPRQQTPVPQQTRVLQRTPAQQTTRIPQQTTPVLQQTTRVLQQTPAQQTTQALQHTPVPQQMRVIQQTPVPQPIPVTQQIRVPQQITVSTIAQAVSTPAPKPLSQDQLIQHLAKQQEQLGEQQQILAQQILQQRLAVLTQQALPVKVTLPSIQNLGFSTILQQGQIAQLGRVNQGLVHTIPNIGQITQMIKTTKPTSQKASVPISLPATNIVWTSPPNVTITSPNGLPRNVAQTFAAGTKAAASAKIKTSTMKETFIDLTECNDPPPYEATRTTQPPPTQTSTTTVVTGKS